MDHIENIKTLYILVSVCSIPQIAPPFSPCRVPIPRRKHPRSTPSCKNPPLTRLTQLWTHPWLMPNNGTQLNNTYDVYKPQRAGPSVRTDKTCTWSHCPINWVPLFGWHQSWRGLALGGFSLGGIFRGSTEKYMLSCQKRAQLLSLLLKTDNTAFWTDWCQLCPVSFAKLLHYSH